MGIGNINIEQLTGIIDDTTIEFQKEKEIKDARFRKNATIRLYLIIMSLLRFVDIMSFLKNRI